MTREDLFTRIAAVRQDTIRLYGEMAKLTDAKKLGWVVREPGAPDVTLALIRAAADVDPAIAAGYLTLIADNDERLLRLARELIHDLRR